MWAEEGARENLQLASPSLAKFPTRPPLGHTEAFLSPCSQAISAPLTGSENLQIYHPLKVLPSA